MRPLTNELDRTGAQRPSPAASAIAQRLSVLQQELEETLPGAEALKAGFKGSMSQNRRVRPGFADAWVVSEPPSGLEIIGEYRLTDASVRVACRRDGGPSLYWLKPDEYELPPAELARIRAAIDFVRQQGAEALSATALSDARQFVQDTAAEYFARHPLARATRSQGAQRAAVLSRVVARYTVGLGVLEHLLEDARVTDIYSDAPCGANPIYVSTNLADDRVGDRLTTNVTITPAALSALATRARLESGRPFSEARPHLEHDLRGYGARLTVIGPPVSPEGVAAAIRRHSDHPLTLVQLVAAGSLAPMTAGLLSAMVEGQCSLLIAGARGAGKTTLLGALLLEMDPSKRIITIEDTLELPVAAMRDCGFRVQSMRVRSALGGEGEPTADEALKISLRLGESALILGEVRGEEARTLYEAMRTGSAGSCVMGTIHGGSAASACTRAVEDLGVPAASFAATDAIVVAGLVRPGGTRRQVRRVTEVSEVLLGSRGLETNDLLTLMGPERVPSEARLLQSPLVQRIAAAWGIPATEVVTEIKARGELKLRQLAVSRALGKPQILEATATVAIAAEYARLRAAGLRGPVLVQGVVDWIRRRWS
jgi:type IV secretory pathway ATPase VirB11/archaellum biosynthesis ATPase